MRKNMIEYENRWSVSKHGNVGTPWFGGRFFLEEAGEAEGNK
jgi:hypothetical protein